MRVFLPCLLLLVFGTPRLILGALDPSWTTSIPPFRIADNLYYVGSQDLASYLVVTPKGNILINANLATSPAQIRTSVEALGFRWSDTKILLNNQAHYDHVAGAAEVIRETHAKNMVMDGDVSVVETGARTDFLSPSPNILRYTPAHVDRVLHDGDTVSLGDVTLTARKTAGHTRGCTTWTMLSHLPGEPAGTMRHIVIVGGTGFWSEYHCRFTGPSRELSGHRSGFPAYLCRVAFFTVRRISGSPRWILRHAHETEALSPKWSRCFYRP
jgi:metallo-beta-lactamase class B